MNFEQIVMVILALLLLAAAGAVIVLWVKRLADLVEIARLRTEIDQGRQAAQRLEDEKRELESRLNDLQRESTEYQKRVSELQARQEEVARAHEEARNRLTETFKSLSSDVLKSSTEQFLHMAQRNFKGEQQQAQAELEKRKQAIEHLIKPIGETLQKIEKMRQEDYGSLSKQLEMMSQDQQMLRSETAKLVNALRRPEVRGRWGEMQLRRVAELAGMIEHCDFVEQQSTTVDGRSFRPDMIVMLPSRRRIVIDAKTPLDAYLSALECADSKERSKHMDDHLRQIEERVSNLASKDYASQFEQTHDFVVLFIPGESFLQAAVQQKPRILESALERGVVIATPSTLISLLKVIALGWREEQLAENARRIAENGRELHKRLATAFEHLDKLGKAIHNTVNAYNRTVGSLEHQVLPQAKRFEEYGAASSRTLPDHPTNVEISPRGLPAVERAPHAPDRSTE